jgi:hypothetical protein
MKTPYGHLTYCTNIHSGESWADHFEQLQKNIPAIKRSLSPTQPFGIGLRLANKASVELAEPGVLAKFKDWLQQQDCYVFTMNGFPYGGFHDTVVKDAVHKPDWTTGERVAYTNRLANILAQLLPANMEGGISTSPLSYRHWFATEMDKKEAISSATQNVLQVVKGLIQINSATGKLIHLDIEPEPGGLLESGTEFIHWYDDHLLPAGIDYLHQQFGFNEEKAVALIKEHVQLCYDVCHFAIGFEDPVSTNTQLKTRGIKTGKIQISAALKAVLPPAFDERLKITEAFRKFNEPTYLHQVIGRQQNGMLQQYNDLPQALADVNNETITEWRAHFHVPVFIKDYGLLQSTQTDIADVVALQKASPFTTHLEVETYTWDVLPDDLKLPQQESITREVSWVLQLLNNDPDVPVIKKEDE